MAHMTQPPHSLSLGDSVYAKVLAINYYGEGLMSNSGNGATCVLVPTKPIFLTNDGAITSESVIAFTWSQGVSTGGRPILDYRVWYDQGLDDWQMITTVPTASYETTFMIISGQTYKFKVEARNEVGYSPFSDELSILAATIPHTPSSPTTYIDGESVVVQWIAPYNGGSNILGYEIRVLTSDNLSFEQDLDNCDGSDPIIVVNKKCWIPFSVLTASPFNLAWGSSIYASVSAANVVGSSEYSH